MTVRSINVFWPASQCQNQRFTDFFVPRGRSGKTAGWLGHAYDHVMTQDEVDDQCFAEFMALECDNDVNEGLAVLESGIANWCQ